MEDMVKILEPFQVATTVLCSEKDATISMVGPIIKSIINNYMLTLPTNNLDAIDFQSAARTSLNRRFTMDGNVAKFLDPRYKSLNSQYIERKTKIINFVKRIMEAATSTDREKEDEEKTPKPTALDFLFNEARQVENWKKQLDMYTPEPEIGHNLGPLLWWKTHMDKYSTMKSLVQKYLSIPATSASSER